MSRTGYCTPGDLLLGNIPFPQWITREQAIGDAADEIDSRIGYRYEVPIVIPAVDTTKPIPAVVGLTLKRINAALASGRMILQVDAGSEDTRLHAYGLSLVQESLEALKCIAAGEITFENVPTVHGDESPEQRGPQIANVDSESQVEAFYDRIANPRYLFPSMY